MIEDAVGSARNSLISSDLGEKLAGILVSAQTKEPGGAVAFIGMDTPELSAEVIREGISVAQTVNGTGQQTDAFVAPSVDGGYTLLVVPPKCPPRVFSAVEWSTENTCATQIQACSGAGCQTTQGEAFSDIDNVDDLQGLIQRFRRNPNLSKQRPRVASFLQTVGGLFSSKL